MTGTQPDQKPMTTGSPMSRNGGILTPKQWRAMRLSMYLNLISIISMLLALGFFSYQQVSLGILSLATFLVAVCLGIFFSIRTTFDGT